MPSRRAAERPTSGCTVSHPSRGWIGRGWRGSEGAAIASPLHAPDGRGRPSLAGLASAPRPTLLPLATTPVHAPGGSRAGQRAPRSPRTSAASRGRQQSLCSARAARTPSPLVVHAPSWCPALDTLPQHPRRGGGGHAPLRTSVTTRRRRGERTAAHPRCASACSATCGRCCGGRSRLARCGRPAGAAGPRAAGSCACRWPAAPPHPVGELVISSPAAAAGWASRAARWQAHVANAPSPAASRSPAGSPAPSAATAAPP